MCNEGTRRTGIRAWFDGWGTIGAAFEVKVAELFGGSVEVSEARCGGASQDYQGCHGCV